MSRTRAAIYTRISDDRSGEAAGVNRQREACEKLAVDRGLQVTAVYNDNSRSAMTGSRPAYSDLLEAVRGREVDCVLVWAVDRLYRRMEDLIELTNVLGNVPVYSVRSGDVDLATADGKLRANIMGSVAQHESEKKGERVTAAAVQRARRGGFSGGQRRFGYRHRDVHPTTGKPTGPLVLVPEEADAIAWAYGHVSRGGTLEAVKREWDIRGLRGPAGARFTGVSVRDVLLRPMNAGLATYKGEVVGKSGAPAIVEEDEFLRARAILSDPRRRTTVGRPPTSLLAGLLKCAVCGGRVSAKNRFGGKARGNIKTPIYTCREGHVTRTRRPLDDAVAEIVLRRVEEQRERILRPAVDDDNGTASVHAREADRISDELAAMPALLASGMLGSADYALGSAALRERLAYHRGMLGKTAKKPLTAAALADTSDIGLWWHGDCDRGIDPATPDDRRALLREWLERIDMHRGTSGKFTTQGIELHWQV